MSMDLLCQPLTICWTLLMSEVLFLIMVHLPGDESSVDCGVAGILLHSFILQIFMWLTVLSLSIFRKKIHSWLSKHKLVVLGIATGEVFSTVTMFYADRTPHKKSLNLQR